MILNPSFESMPAPLSGWDNDSYNDANYYSNITADNTMHVTGSYSARLDISSNSTALKSGAKNIAQAHLSLVQYPPPNTFFDNLTDRSDGLNLWFQIHPKFSGYTIFEVRIRTGGLREMDYIYYNSTLGYGWGNSTTGSEGGKPLKQIILPAPPLDQWNHLVRNVRQDWLAPLKLPDGTSTPSFPLNDTVNRIEAGAYYARNTITGIVNGETVWVDDVTLYRGNCLPLPSFSFQDQSGNPVDQRVTWKILNSSGLPVTLAPGTLIKSGVYTLLASFEGYPIYKERITPITLLTIRLPIAAIDVYRSGYIAINSTVSTINVVENTESQIAFNASGIGPSLIVADIPIQPIGVVKDGAVVPTWTYDGTSRILAIRTVGLGTFSVSYRTLITLPSFTFQDRNGHSVDDRVQWRIYNSQGAQVRVIRGWLVPTGAYTVQTYYGGYVVYHASITQALSVNAPIQLEMMPLGASTLAYLAFNSTINTISILENTSNRIVFSASGAGPSLIIVNVPMKPLSVERDGSAILSWRYNSTTSTVAIQTAQLGTFTMIYSNSTHSTSLLLYIAASIAGALIVIASIVVWRKKVHSKRSTGAQPARLPESMERFKPKNKKSSICS